MNQFQLRPAHPEDAVKVEAFNRRLTAVGVTHHRLSLQPPFRTMKHSAESPIKAQRFFCLEGDEIRGGINVKRMMFKVNGIFEEVACRVYPLSEGIINPAFRGVGKFMMEELLRRYPLIYGLVDSKNPGLKQRIRIGWFTMPVPFHYAIFQGYSFLRNINYLRKRKWLRILLDLAAISGMGTTGLFVNNLLQKLRHRNPNVKNLTIERFDGWGDWADDVWQIAQDSYSLIGDRSKSALQSLYPKGHKHLIKLRFKIADSDRLVGWAVITVAKKKDHKHFGNMILGAIVDMLALPDDAFLVASGALVAARQERADLLVVNHSDARWNAAFKRAGMIPMKTNLILALSPKLEQRFDSIGDHVHRLYFTLGDGHGPTSFWMTDYSSPISLVESS